MTTILTNSNVYLGTSLFGKVSKFTTPDIEMEKVEIKNGYGTFKLPVGVNALSSSFDMLCLDSTVFKKVANPFESFTLTVYGNLSQYNNETLTKETQAKLILRGSLSKRSLLGELEAQNNNTYTVDLDVTAFKLIVAGETWEEFDAANLIWKISGKDVLAKMKKNLGIS